MKTESLFPKGMLNEVTLEPTEQCNFSCIHCYKGEPSSKYMSLHELELVVSKIITPDLERIVITGGEARCHPQFEKIGPLIGEVIKEGGGGLASETVSFIRQLEMDVITKILSKELDLLPSGQERTWKRTGEIAPFIERRRAALGHQYYSSVELVVNTNGWGMENPERTAAILNELHRQGYSGVCISLDKAHKMQERQIDYPLLSDLTERDDFKRQQLYITLRLPKSLDVRALGTTNYAIPIGRAAKLSQKERILLADDHPNGQQVTVKEIENRLRKEYKNWDSIFGNYYFWYGLDNKTYTTNCYCDPTTFYRSAERALTYSPGNRLVMWKFTIGADLSAHLCGLNVLPKLGDMSVDNHYDIFQRALSSKLIEIIAHQGPHGLARVLTKLPEDKIRKMFTESCPCGICNFLMEKYPQQMVELANTPSSFRKLAEKAANR